MSNKTKCIIYRNRDTLCIGKIYKEGHINITENVYNSILTIHIPKQSVIINNILSKDNYKDFNMTYDEYNIISRLLDNLDESNLLILKNILHASSFC